MARFVIKFYVYDIPGRSVADGDIHGAMEKLPTTNRNQRMLWALWCAADALIEEPESARLDFVLNEVATPAFLEAAGDEDFAALPAWAAEHKGNLSIEPA